VGDYARACEAVGDHLDELHRAWAMAWRQDYLGHRNVQNTTLYTALAPNRHAKIWRQMTFAGQ